LRRFVPFISFWTVITGDDRTDRTAERVQAATTTTATRIEDDVFLLPLSSFGRVLLKEIAHGKRRDVG
jgi:hypothetical protein